MSEETKTPSIPKRKEPPTLRYLDPGELRVYYGPGGQIYATINNEVTLLEPRFVRVHPLSNPDVYLSVRETDPGRGKEHGLLRNWRKLDSESRTIVEQELERRYLQPVLKRILSVRDYGGAAVCLFDTDRGMREVTVRDARDSVVYLGSRVLFSDAQGTRYDIPDINALDAHSAQLLTRLI